MSLDAVNIMQMTWVFFTGEILVQTAETMFLGKTPRIPIIPQVPSPLLPSPLPAFYLFLVIHPSLSFPMPLPLPVEYPSASLFLCAWTCWALLMVLNLSDPRAR